MASFAAAQAAQKELIADLSAKGLFAAAQAAQKAARYSLQAHLDVRCRAGSSET